ncbi:zinc ABC transporter substrate-binding protein [candidate division KSB1 bacterium]|nr:zinc ABC transporter substrate-binding protein [candidate division KSB1 bacterium]NIR71103.1 zinc ABC transporter substrate-binding protein [candidate division KSB1 bacterium]NIS23263.1 zinc ABC transporter substrate-binding protein [candidate division KSB1 bacterium]NIT70143.1 zinc ABC transporter substrate-binding protein [candidate division KSB1 bacterium]NIU23793.1 zinc ABC transporter substrate-binding protein [candidate division KSB1 bacterium]
MKVENIFIVLIVLGLFVSPLFSNSKIRVITTLPDFKDIAERIGGDKVEVEALAKGYQDPHYVDAKPSFMVKLNKADLFIWAGLDLEVGWVPPLVEGARNSDILWGAQGNLDASNGIPLLQIPDVPAAQLRAGGDLHIYGNPHYWLDPLRGKTVAQNIFDKLAQIAQEHQTYFSENLEQFKKRIDQKVAEWIEKMAPYGGTKIIAYHNSWPYFEQRFGIEIAGFIEPKPGIPPSPGHLVSVIKKMKQQDIKIIIISPYFDDKPAESVAKRTDATVVRFAPSVGAFKEVKTYFDLFEYNINALIEAFKEKSIPAKPSTK